MLPFLLSTRRGRCPHRPITLSESGEGASGERADVGSAARRPPFGAQLPHSGGTWRKDRPLRETSPMAPGQARFVDLARPRHPAGERQWVLGCRSMQVSGAGVESYVPSTEPGVGKGGVPLFSPSLGTFLGEARKVQTSLGETACGQNGEKGQCLRQLPQLLAAKRWPGRIFRSI